MLSFARIARLGAILVVALAVWRAQTPRPTVHVAILALPSVAQEAFHLEEPAAFEGAVSVPTGSTGADFWRRVFAGETIEGREAGELSPLWVGSPGAVRALAAPVRVFGSGAATAAAVEGFLGSSTGAFVAAEDVHAGRLPAPYDRVVAAITAAAKQMPLGQWSDWISVYALPSGEDKDGHAAPPAKGQFQFVRLDDQEYFFSPAYRDLDHGVTAAPFLRAAPRDVRPLLATHVESLSERRLASSGASFAPGGSTRPIVVFDAQVEETKAIFAPDFTPAVVRQDIEAALALRVETLRAAVGPTGALVVVGGPSSSRRVGEPAWVKVFGGDNTVSQEGGAGSPVRVASEARALSFDDLRSLVLYFSGVSLDSAETKTIPAEVARLFPVPPASSRESSGSDAELAANQDWSVATLGSIPGALGRRD